MYILGINAFNCDSSAALLADGRLVAAIEEERIRRVKHWGGFPSESIRFVLGHAGLRLAEIDHVAVGRRPLAHLHRKILFSLRHRPSWRSIGDRLANMNKVMSLKGLLAEGLGEAPETVRAAFHAVEHHRAHMASSYFLSPFEDASCLTLDGSGDFVSAMFASGRGNRLTPEQWVEYPHSLGLMYTACAQYLGFNRFGDEYKVMGLAAHGEPEFLEALRRIVPLRANGKFELDLPYFRHPTEGVSMEWRGSAPDMGPVFSDAWVRRFGPARREGEPLEERHRNLACSMQAVAEDVYAHTLGHLFLRHRNPRLCLAGGCAYNSVANGKITERMPFTDLHVHPAAGDAGTAVGAALSVWHERLGRPREHRLEHAFLGAGYSDARIRRALAARDLRYTWIEDEGELLDNTVERLAAGDVVGWFQGRGEWGPRALGHRSILADPRRPEMTEILNARIKRRESFRPFAPAILEERCADYFERSEPVPFMLQVYRVRADRRDEIPAVVHVDGTGRLQTVNRTDNPLFHGLIAAFDRTTGTPVLLNTSFNENEPIVNDPEQAIDCFLRTGIDLLVLGRAFVRKGV